jgi:hypothetical protein
MIDSEEIAMVCGENRHYLLDDTIKKINNVKINRNIYKKYTISSVGKSADEII